MMETWVRQNVKDGRYYVTDPQTEPFVYKHFKTTATTFKIKVLKPMKLAFLHLWNKELGIKAENGMVDGAKIGKTKKYGDLEITYVDGFLSKPHFNKMISYLLHGFQTDDLLQRLLKVEPINHSIVLPDPDARKPIENLSDDVLYETFVTNMAGEKLIFNDVQQTVRVKGNDLNVTWISPEVLYVDDFPRSMIAKRGFQFPSPLHPSPGKFRETTFEGGPEYFRTQADYLESRHKGYCSIYGAGDSSTGTGIIFNVPLKIALTAIEVPKGIKFSEGDEIDLSVINTTLEWLCHILTRIERDGKLPILTRLDPQLATMIKIIQKTIEILAVRSTKFNEIGLLAMAGFLHFYHLKDYKYMADLSLDTYTTGEIKAELAWFQKYGLTMKTKSLAAHCRYEFTVPKLIVDPSFEAKFLKCESSRFVLTFLHIGYFTPELKWFGGHSNSLLYDRNSNTVERFEPHAATDEFNRFAEAYLDDYLKNYFKAKFKANYLSPLDWCPVSVQAEQEKELNKGNVRGKIDGFCQAWSFWYADLRLSNPDLTREQVIEMAMAKLKQRPETLTEYIISYAKWYENAL